MRIQWYASSFKLFSFLQAAKLTLWVDSFNSAPLTTPSVVFYASWVWTEVCLSVALVPVPNSDVTLYYSTVLHHIWVADRTVAR